jgi:outer membrane murein-binding lipoprotein Lpp
MVENKFRIESTKSNQARVKEATSGTSIFSFIEKRLKLETYLEEGFPIQYLPKILFAVFLSLVYISNTHYGERTTRQIDRLQTEVEDLRADYTTLKADVMFASKQSEVARRVRDLGLQESSKPPIKVVVDKDEY